MPRIAYGILCHNSTWYVREQFQMLFSKNAVFLYHVDLGSPNEIKSFLSQLTLRYPNVRVLPPTYCAWGGFSLTSAMVGLIRAALSQGAWDHFIFLSEQHLPLQNYDTISTSLLKDHNYAELTNFRSLPPAGQEDVHNRFARKYQEVPGVGSFATTDLVPSEEFLDALYHGSQWMALCRRTCEQIPELEANFFAPFKHSVLSDENALQTWLGQHFDERVVNENRNLTLIAAPHNGGSRDMIFDDPVFSAARDSRYLFIRKRPPILSENVSGWYANIIPNSEREKVVTIESGIETWDSVPELMAGWLNRIAVKGTQFAIMPTNVLGPRFFCKAQHSGLSDPFSIYVLSQDLVNFKVIAVLHQTFWNFNESMISPYRASVIRMRGHDLSFHREIHLGSDHNEGYHQIRGIADLEGLMTVIEAFVERTLTLVGRYCSHQEEPDQTTHDLLTAPPDSHAPSERKEAIHPSWRGHLKLSDSGNLVEHEGHGSKGTYSRTGRILIVYWEKYQSDVFLEIAGIYVHEDLLTHHSQNLNMSTVIVGNLPVKARSISVEVPGGDYGVTLRLATTDIPTFRQIFVDNNYESPNLPKSADVIVDLGANIGLATVFFGLKYPEAKILAIEPEENNFTAMVGNTAALGRRVQTLHAAAWTKDGIINLHSEGENGSHLGAWGVQVSDRKSVSGNCSCYKISTLLGHAGFGSVDILKIDIEGAELEVFSDGAEEWLPRVNLIIVETHDRFRPGSDEAVRKAIGTAFEELPRSGENLFFRRLAKG